LEVTSAVSHTFQMQRVPELRFSTMLGEETELALL
jgi:hypothetical protein